MTLSVAILPRPVCHTGALDTEGAWVEMDLMLNPRNHFRPSRIARRISPVQADRMSIFSSAMQGVRTLVLMSVCIISSIAGAQELRTGEFETTFTQRSPLSEKKELLKRLGHKNAEDYDLSREPFLIYVPADYDPSASYGLILWINHEDVTVAPPKWMPLLDQSRLIFVVSKSAAQEDWIRAGLALDAAHNLKTLYRVDEDRVYLFAMPPAEHPIGQRMGLAFPDAFNAFIYFYNQRYFRAIPIPGQPGMSYATSFSRSPPPQFAQAKTRRHVIVADPQFASITRNIYQAYQEDGFRQILFLEAPLD